MDELKGDYYEILGSVAQLERTLHNSALVAESISAKARKPIPVWTALDEWGIVRNWTDLSKRDDVHKMEFIFNLRDALWVASALNAIQRNGRTVRMANLSELVNCQGPMLTSPTDLLFTTTYYPLELYANRSGNVALDVLALSPRFATKNFADMAYLDVSATYDEEKKRVTLAAVNRRKEGDLIANVELAGVRAKPGGRVFQITGAGPDAMNTFSAPHAVGTQEMNFESAGSQFAYQFPRHSVSWLEFEIE
jgi:alpha-N-arabinofuranosidase